VVAGPRSTGFPHARNAQTTFLVRRHFRRLYGRRGRIRERVEKADHYVVWIRCAIEGRPTCLPIEFASHLTELALLGTLALPTRKVLEWDTAEMRVTNE
jgi:hypothetical protein